MKKDDMEEEAIESKEPSVCPAAPPKEEPFLAAGAEVLLGSTEEKKTEISSAELNNLKEKAALAEKHYDQMLRIQANLENYRKRVEREREEIIRRANEHLLKELILIMDNFELGLQSAMEGQNREAILDGMEMVYSQLQSFLKKMGVEVIDAAGQTFDPAIHEAIAHQTSDNPAGQIIGQTRKGYKLKGHLLRAAAVIVSKGRPS